MELTESTIQDEAKLPDDRIRCRDCAEFNGRECLVALERFKAVQAGRKVEDRYGFPVWRLTGLRTDLPRRCAYGKVR